MNHVLLENPDTAMDHHSPPFPLTQAVPQEFTLFVGDW